MFYPDDFKTKVKEVYPDWKKLHRLLDSGNEMVGRYLFDSFRDGLPIEAILDSNSLEELQKAARIEDKKRQLYLQWAKLPKENFIH